MNRREILLAAAAAALPLSRSAIAASSPEDPSALSLADASRAIHSKAVTSHELTLACLQRILHANFINLQSGQHVLLFALTLFLATVQPKRLYRGASASPRRAT